MNLYSINVRIYATAYIKADSEREARRIARELKGDVLQLREDEDAELPISDRQYDDPDLPDVSLSPAMTIHGIDRGEPIELSEENIDEEEGE
jgi:hypothetical protein